MESTFKAGPAALIAGTRLALLSGVMLAFELVAESLRKTGFNGRTLGFVSAFAVPILLLGVVCRRYGSLMAYAVGIGAFVAYCIALDTLSPGSPSGGPRSPSVVGALVQIAMVGYVAAPILAWRRERKLLLRR